MRDPSDLRSDDLPLKVATPPQNEEGKKDELHLYNTRTPPVSLPGTVTKRKTTTVEDTYEYQSQVSAPSSLTHYPNKHQPKWRPQTNLK